MTAKLRAVRSARTIRLATSLAALGLLFAPVWNAGAQMLGDAAGPPPAAAIQPQPVQPQPLQPQPLQPPLNAAPPMAAPPSFDSVMASAFSESSFTFDRTMLQAADGFFAGGDPETRRVLAGLNSITVRNYHARDFARYDPSALAAIDLSMRGAGWKHLVNGSPHGGGPATDMWLHFQGATVTNVTVVTRGDRNMSVVAVDCVLRPLDLLHLSGHFGIPRVDESAVMVPAH